MPSSASQGEISNRARPLTLCTVVIVVSSLAAALVLFLLGLGEGWAASLAVFSLVSAFAIDMTVAWYGVYLEWSHSMLAALVGGHALVAYIISLLTRAGSDNTAIAVIAAVVITGLLAGFENVYANGRVLLRSFKGLRTSGRLEDGIVGARVPAPIVASFGDGILEDRLRLEIESTAKEDEIIEFTEKKDTKLGVNIQQVGSTRILHRIKDGRLEALCVPVDGAVARFELAEKFAKSLAFVSIVILHFEPPGASDVEDIRRNLKSVYALYSAPTYSLRQWQRWIGESLRVRKRAILVGALSIAALIIGTVAIVNVDRVLMMLAEPRVNAALSSAFYIVSISVVVAGFLKWLQSRKRGKS